MDRQGKGFSLLELMITLVIIIVITTIGYITLGGYIPKQRLISSVQGMANLLQHAQSEAYARNNYVGVIFTKTAGHSYLENDNDWMQDPDEPTLKTVTFKKGVALVDDACNRFNPGTATTSFFFTPTGESVWPGGADRANIQIFLESQYLEKGANAYEIEVTQSGLVEVIKWGSSGYLVGETANATCPPP